MQPYYAYSIPQPRRSIRHKFTPEEDMILKNLVHESGNEENPGWNYIAEELGHGRTARQCRERYKNYLSSKVKNGSWTDEEEKLLEEKFHQMGPKWSKMTAFFNGRTDVSIKNHWSAMLNRRSKEEFEQRHRMLEQKAKQQEELKTVKQGSRRPSQVSLTADHKKNIDMNLPFDDEPVIDFNFEQNAGQSRRNSLSTDIPFFN